MGSHSPSFGYSVLLSKVVVSLVLVVGSAVYAQDRAGASQPYTGPVIDAHNHWNGSRDASRVAELMRKNRVVGVIFMPRAYGSQRNSADLPTSDEAAATELEPFKDLFFPTVGMQLPMLTDANWENPGPDLEMLYEQTEQKLRSGRYVGIGEVIVRHYPYFNHPSVSSSGKNMDVRKRFESAHIRRLAQMAGVHGVPLVFHMEGEPPLVAEAEPVFKDHPQTTFIWSHMCGRVSNSELARLLNAHPNLYCDMAAMTNTGPTGYGFSEGRDFPSREGWPMAFAWTHIVESNGEFFPDVKRLLLRFPTRFLGVGMDNAHGPLPSRAFRERLQRFRVLLGTLPPDVAKQLACTNAKVVWKLQVGC